MKSLDDETLGQRYSLSRETYEKIKEEALPRLNDDQPIRDVAKALKIAGFTTGEIAASFDALAADGYSFLPEILKYSRAKVKRPYPVETNVDREEMAAYLRYQAWKQQRDVLREEKPVLSQVFPGMLQGLRADAKNGRDPDKFDPKDPGRIAVDAFTAPFRAGWKAFGDAIDKSKYPELYANPETRQYIPGRWKGQDMDDPAGAFNDVWMAASMLNPGKLVRAGAGKILGKTAVPRIAGRGLQVLGTRASKYAPPVGRFLTDVGVETAGAYGASRISDFTRPYSVAEAGIGGGAGIGAQRLLENLPRARAFGKALRAKSSALKDRALPTIYGERAVPAVPARGAEDGLEAAQRSAFDGVSQNLAITSNGTPAAGRAAERTAGGVPVSGASAAGEAAGRAAGAQGDVFAQNVKDPTLRYLIQKLGLKPEEIPGAVFNTRGGESVIGALERNIGSSAHGDQFLQRHAAFKTRLNKRMTEALNAPVNGRLPNTDPTDAIYFLRDHWKEIKDRAFDGHFNFANKFEGQLAEDLAQADEIAYSKLLQMADADPGIGISETLAKYASPTRTKDLLKTRRGQINQKQAGWENVDEFRKLGQDEQKLIDQVEEALGDDDFSPLRRIRQLAYGVQNINDYLFTKSAEKKLLNSSEKFLSSLKQRMKDDMEAILTSGWFGDAGQAAVGPWRESAEKAAKFLEGERALAPYLNPQTIDATGFVNHLKGGRDFDAKVRTALEMGGEFGKNSLDDMRRIQLLNTIKLDKDGIAGTTTRENADKISGPILTLFDKGDPLLGEYLAIVTALSRAGSPIEAGSAAGRNFISEFLIGEPSHWWKMRKLNAAREEALVREGIIPPKRAAWEDAVATPSTGARAAEEAPVPGPMTEAPELPGERVPAPPERSAADVIATTSEPSSVIDVTPAPSAPEPPALPPSTSRPSRLRVLGTTAANAASGAAGLAARRKAQEDENDRWLAEHYGWKPRAFFEVN